MRSKLIVIGGAVCAIALIFGAITMLGLFDRDEAPPQSAGPNHSIPVIQLDITQASLDASGEKRLLEASIKSSDMADIVRVEYHIDGKIVTKSTIAPFVVTIALGAFRPGTYQLQARAYDAEGKFGESERFNFTIAEGRDVVPADKSSQSIIYQSTGPKTVSKANPASAPTPVPVTPGTPATPPTPSPGPPWPSTPPAEICDSTALLGGPSSAPTGAVVVPAGDNSAISFVASNATYWFAPGTHTLGIDPFSQIIPGNNSQFIGAPGAILDGQGLNYYAFTQQATNVTIRYLTIQNFIAPMNEGVINHDSGAGWTMEYITAQNNSGGAVFVGTNNTLRYSCLRDNGQYGFQVYNNDVGGPTNIILDHNEVSGNNTDDWETQIPGCGCTGGGKFWDAHEVDITNNYIHDNLSVGLWADTNDTDFLVEGNYIEGNHSMGLFYEISYNMIVRNNNFIRNGLVAGPTNNSFPSGAIYLSESGGDSRVAGRTANIDIYDNQFTDNWSGVILWENADRYCASPSNTSTGYCTIVDPGTTLTTCGDPGSGGSVNVEPYLSNCRWKTQNVKVHNNVFDFERADIAGCTVASSCGFQGAFANVGSSPSWSPYMGSGTQEDIIFNQNNLFSYNTYLGDWYFMPKEQNKRVNFAIWQNTPYGQDVGSTFNGANSLVVDNALDDETATLENTVGLWTSWFSSSVARSTAEAHTGNASLQISITAPFGWGVELTNSNGMMITPADKTVSFWGKLGSGSNLGATMELNWLDDDLNLISSDTVSLTGLNASWQQVSADFTPPAGAITVDVNVYHSSGTAGNSLYLDDIIIADNP